MRETDDKERSDRIIDAKERRSMIPYSDMHIWRLERIGAFPQRIVLGTHRIGWSLAEINAWIADRKKARTLKDNV